MADKLQGTWVFDKYRGQNRLFPWDSCWRTWTLNFTSDGKAFTSLKMGSHDFSNGTHDPNAGGGNFNTNTIGDMVYYGDENVWAFVINAESTGSAGHFAKEEYKTIIIYSKYDEVENADTLVKALTARATHTIVTGDAFEITMTSAKGILLETAGKYCEKNILVTPEFEPQAEPNIQPLVITKNGTYTAQDGVDGYSPITVDVATSGGGESGNFPIGDGDTHIWIRLGEGRTSPYLGVGLNGTVTVDWGDGTEHDTLKGTSTSREVWASHNYVSAGDYVIRLSVDGEMALNGSSASGTYAYILRSNHSNVASNSAYRSAVRKVEIGNSTIIGDHAFRECLSLEAVSIPSSVTSIGSYAFYNCAALASISIPSSVTSIGSNAFYECSRLTAIKVPSGVTSIGGSVFKGCSGVVLFDFTEHTAVPTLTSTSAFSSTAEDLQIRVPSALYDEWIAATNWSSLASKIVSV